MRHTSTTHDWSYRNVGHEYAQRTLDRRIASIVAFVDSYMTTVCNSTTYYT